MQEEARRLLLLPVQRKMPAGRIQPQETARAPLRTAVRVHPRTAARAHQQTAVRILPQTAAKAQTHLPQNPLLRIILQKTSPRKRKKPLRKKKHWKRRSRKNWKKKKPNRRSWKKRSSRKKSWKRKRQRRRHRNLPLLILAQRRRAPSA